MKPTTILLISGLLLFSTIQEISAQENFFILRQPDGTTFRAIERGDEWLRFFETPEGYIVRRDQDGYFKYFNINARGDFIATNLKVGIDPLINVAVRPYENPAVLRALNRKIDAYNAAAEVNRKRYLQRQQSILGSTNALGKGSVNITMSSQQQVTLNVGVLLVEFNDVPHYTGGNRPNGYTVADFETMLFSDNQYTNLSPNNERVFGSLRDYFQYQSHGILQVTGQIINPDSAGQPNWLNMGNSSNYNSSYWGIRVLLRDAINAAIAQGWNVNYDIIAMVLAQDQYAPNVGFWTGYAYFQTHFSAGDFDNDGDGVPDFNYANWFGGYAVKEREDLEWRDEDQATFTHIGLHCHEMFHVLGWGIPNILGEGSAAWWDRSTDWTLMGMGYRTGPLRKGESPVDLDPVARILMEWAVPTDVATNLNDEPITYIEEDADLNETFDFYRLTSPYSIEEFIVENRQYSGFNSYLPEWWKSGTKGGLLVWRHASSTSQDRSLRRADNDNDVVLEGMPHVYDGDLGDSFPGASNNREITPYTTPNTNPDAYGTFTGVAITDISNSANTMTADLWSDFPPDAPKNLRITNPSQDGANPVLQWDANSESDLDHYLIWRGTTPNWKTTPVAWETSPAANVTVTTWTDNQTIIDLDVLRATYYRITAVDNAGNESDYSNSTSTTSSTVFKQGNDKRDPESLPKEFALRQNFPNPFNPQTKIRFDLPKEAHVILKICNILGEDIRTLVNRDMEMGFHSVIWDGKDEAGKDLPSGIYIYQLQAKSGEGEGNSFVAVKKLTLLR